MKFNEFLQYVEEHILEGWMNGTGIQVSINQVMKNNGSFCTALSICNREQRVVPNVYLEGFYEMYQKGADMDQVMNEIRKAYDMAMRNIPVEFNDVPDIIDFEKVKDKVIFQLVNFEKNEERLKNCPYLKINDLAVLFRILISHDDIGNSSCVVSNEIACEWNMTPEEIFKVAKINTKKIYPKKFRNIMEVIFEMSGQMFCDPGEKLPMYVLSNQIGMNGASCLLYDGVLEECSEELGGSFYILPSSIHESILVPAGDISEPEDLIIMVRQINMTEVSPDEVLSDSVYYYDNDKKNFSMIAE